MSASLGKRPNCFVAAKWRDVPIAAFSRASLNELVGAGEQPRRNGEAERLGGFEVDDQLNLRGLLDRQVGRLLPLEYPAGVDTNLTGPFRKATSVTHQAAGRGAKHGPLRP